MAAALREGPLGEELKTAVLDYGQPFKITWDEVVEVASMTVSDALCWPYGEEMP